MKMLENTFETLIVFSPELELYSSLVTWISILMEGHLRVAVSSGRMRSQEACAAMTDQFFISSGRS